MLWLTPVKLFLLASAVSFAFLHANCCSDAACGLTGKRKPSVCFHSKQTPCNNAERECCKETVWWLESSFHTCHKKNYEKKKQNIIAPLDYRSGRSCNLQTVDAWYHSVNTRLLNRCGSDTWVCAAAGNNSCLSHNREGAASQLLRCWKQRQVCGTRADKQDRLATKTQKCYKSSSSLLVYSGGKASI